MKILDDFTTPVNQTMLGKKVVGFQWFPIKIDQLLAVFFFLCVCVILDKLKLDLMV